MSIIPTILINIAYIFLLLSYIVNNLILLRFLTIGASIFLLLWIGFFVDYPENISLLIWNSIFLSINIFYIVKDCYYKYKQVDKKENEPNDMSECPV
jgi:hypothetical protein